MKFQPEVISEALGRFKSACHFEESTHFRDRTVTHGHVSWGLDTDSEFMSEYRQALTTSASYQCFPGSVLFALSFEQRQTIITVKLEQRGEVQRVFEVFDANEESSRLPEPELRALVTVFIGHGRTGQWKDLKDHLHEKHGFKVIAYETAARAGYSITEVLTEVKRQASFALLVHTAEDEDSTGELHARENVIHETGLFQGRLGFKRAVVIREESCNGFSNLAGIQEIRYAKGNIKETFGEVLATLRREFSGD